MAKDDTQAKELEKPPARGVEDALMARLGRVVEALELRSPEPRVLIEPDDQPLADLQAEERVTPDSWDSVALHGKRPVPGHVVALVTANALLDACSLTCPGTDRDRAQELATRLLDEQWEHGMFHVNPADDPGEHLAEWDAAMAAILYVAHRAPLPLIEERVAGWWRQVFDSSQLGGEAADAWLFIDHGERVTAPTLAARFFYLMENVPLPKPAQPWKVVV